MNRVLLFTVFVFMTPSASMAQLRSSPHPVIPHRSPERRRKISSGVSASRYSTIPAALGLSFAPVVTYGSGGSTAYSLESADVNGDGKLDVAVVNNCGNANCWPNSLDGSVSILLGNGDGTFQNALPYDTGGYYPYSIAVADVNGDGKPDVVVTNECTKNVIDCTASSVGVLMNNGDGTLQPVATYDSGGLNALGIAIADVNGDGRPDLFVANQCPRYPASCADGVIGVLLGNGDGTFQTAIEYDTGAPGAMWVTLGDTNGDGKPDLVVANQNDVAVLLGNGDGSFRPAMLYSAGPPTGLFSVTTVDMNGDGKLDIVVSSAYSVGISLGNGDGTFQTGSSYGSGGGGGGFYTQSVAVGDIDRDGELDVMVTTCQVPCASNTPGLVSVLLGKGDGSLQNPVSYSAGGSGSSSVAVGDVNQDGKPDLLVSNWCSSTSSSCSGGTVGVLINTSRNVTATTVTSSRNPSQFAQSVTFNATVSSTRTGTPTGSVTFFDGNTTLGNSPLNSSATASLTTSTLLAGTHSITGSYGGDTNFAPSTSPVLNQVVQAVPLVSLSATSLDFGNEGIHKISAPQYVTLTNTGDAALTINSIASSNSDYSQASNCPLVPSTLVVNGSCVISVRFKPSAVGSRSGSIRISDNASNSPQTIGLSGNGVTSNVTLSTSNVLFGVQLLGTTSGPKPVKLTNTSSTNPLKISSIVVGGDFSLASTSSQCPSTGSVAAGSSCYLAVRFSPMATGTRYGTLTINDSDPATPQIVGLSGLGTAVKLSSKKVGFGSVIVGQSSKVKTVTVTNVGSTALTIAGITVSGTNVGDFAQANTCGSSLAAGAKCFINVTFTPTAIGARTAIISVADSDPTTPQTITVLGTGT